jgi:3-oxoacyl-(acyl-carrier-protein) synthase/SAM-dependent methyltransferase
MSELDQMSPVKRALVEIRRLKAKLAERPQGSTEPVAILGAALRFPGGLADPDSFWRLLADGGEAIGPTPQDRWDADALFDPAPDAPGRTYATRGGFLADVDLFDAEFFGVTPREAESMDPQQRILLELAWEALERAGIDPTGLRGTRTGVFLGLSHSDYGRLLLQPAEDIDAYSSSGGALSIAAGRIAYALDLRGPNLVVDTACSASLMALHLACRSLRAGECDLALVGGANLMLAPEATISFSHGRMLSPDGRCKTFDAAADGYVRGEGCAVVVLKRLGEARAAGDPVLAVVRGSAANHDGRSAGLTAPNGPSQEAVIRAALADAGLSAADIDYVEAHGTGTSLGDPIELQALAAAYGDRAGGRPLRVGSVKTNLGHLEATAGLAGVLKTALALEREALPPHRNFERPSPHVDWDRAPLTVGVDLSPWPRGERPRRAGVSAFGFSGANVHVILEEAPRPAAAERPAADADGPQLFCLSARSPEALRALAGRYVDWLAASPGSLADICRSAAVGRAHHAHRLAVLASDPAALSKALQAWLAGRAVAGLSEGVVDGPAPALAVECGETVEGLDAWAVALSAKAPAFREAWAASDADPTAFHVALAAFWRALGLRLTAAYGPGAGERAAAAIAGLDDGAGDTAFVSTRTGRIETTLPAGPAADRSAQARAAIAGLGAGLTLAQGGGAAVALDGGEAGPADPWLAVLSVLKALYVGGETIAWRWLWDGAPQPRLALPTYPFQRRRFWKPSIGPASAAPADRLDWPALLAEASAQSETGPLGWNPGAFPAIWTALQDLTAGHAANALIELGVFTRAGDRASAAEIVKRFGVVPRYESLVGRWLELLADRGRLSRDGTVFIADAPLEPIDMADAWRTAEALSLDAPGTLDYARRTSKRLPDLLTGRVSPLEVLFAKGSFDSAQDLYERNPTARYLNAIVASALRSALAAAPAGGFRLLEVGAGTGGTTSRLAPIFPADGEYWFTDVSDAFLEGARRRFGAHPALRLAKFDLEGEPPADVAAGGFDMVVAANVVHATRDVGATLDRLHGLLRPGGLLVMIEPTVHHDFFDISIAFIEGWSAFADAFRTEHPLLSPDAWTGLMTARGFEAAARLPAAGSAADDIGQHVLIARKRLSAASAKRPRRTAAAEAGAGAPLERAASGDGSERSAILAASGRDRRARVERLVRRALAGVMRLDGARELAPRARFSDLGLDSLMALQLKSEIGEALDMDAQLPATLAFDTGTVESLTDWLCAAIGGEAPAAAAAAPRAAPADALSAETVDQMSDEEVEALLAHRLQGGRARNPT